MKTQYENIWKNDPENKKMRSVWGKKGSEFMKSPEGRAFASGRIGQKNSNYNSTIFTFKHDLSNEMFTGTIYEFRTKYTLRQSSVSLMITKKRNTVSGWRLID